MQLKIFREINFHDEISCVFNCSKVIVSYVEISRFKISALKTAYKLITVYSRCIWFTCFFISVRFRTSQASYVLAKEYIYVINDYSVGLNLFPCYGIFFIRASNNEFWKQLNFIVALNTVSPSSVRRTNFLVTLYISTRDSQLVSRFVLW